MPTSRRLPLTLWGLLVGLACATPAAAQSFHAEVHPAPRPEVRIGLEEVRRGPDTISGTAVLARRPGLQLAVRRREAFGPLGTLVLEMESDVRVGREAVEARASAGARGSYGPVALRTELAAWSAPPERFDAVEDPGDVRAARGVHLGAGSDVRLDGTWIASLDARFERDLARPATTVDASAGLRARRLLSRTVDPTLEVEGRVADRGEGRLGIGAGIVVRPRRAPDVAATAWWDMAPTASGLRGTPGLETRGTLHLDAVRLAWRLRYRPLAPDRRPTFAQLTLTTPWREGALEVAGSVGRDRVERTHAAVRVGYDLPLGR